MSNESNRVACRMIFRENFNSFETPDIHCKIFIFSKDIRGHGKIMTRDSSCLVCLRKTHIIKE